MTINEFFESGNHIMTAEEAASYPFFGTDRLAPTEQTLQDLYGMREIFYTSDTMEVLIKKLVKNCFYINTYAWTTLLASSTLTYNPLERTNIYETDTETNSGTDSNTSASDSDTSLTVTPNTTKTVAKRTFNDATFNDIDKETNGGTENNIGSSLATNTSSTTYGHIINKVHNITGKENLDIEAVIKAEREIANFNYIGQIAEAIANYISLMSYNFDDVYDPMLSLYP